MVTLGLETSPFTRRFFVALLFGLFFVKASWVDRDSPQHAKRTVSLADGREQTLVFSDEFSVDGRSFRDGRDPRWTSIHKDDYTNFALQFYNQDLVTTTNGYLNISSVIQDITFDINDVLNQQQTRQTKNYQSGMVQGWNKFCFTGGILEIRAKLPGKAYVGGLWPAMWLLGNLARATYVGSSNNVWPWSYNTCSAELQPQQLISACNTVNHYNLHAKQGRGAPEIDLLEAMPGHEKLVNTPIHKPYFSTSLQVAPGSNIEDYRPTVAEVPPEGFWYDRGLEYGPNTSINIFFYGMHLSGSTKQASYLADAISANTNLEPTHFESFHTYRLEWEPYSVAALDSDDDGVQARDEKSKSHGPDDPAPTASPTHKSFNQARDGGAEEVGGYIKWYLDDEFLYSIDTMTLAKTGAIIPQEPMYVILNTALSSTWGFPSPCPENCPCDCFDCREERCQCGCPAEMCSNFPAHFLIDYVRVYQRQNGDTGGKGHVVGCSPPLHPTKTYIKGNADLFMKKGDVEPLLPVQTGGTECENAGTRSESAFRDPKGYVSFLGVCSNIFGSPVVLIKSPLRPQSQHLWSAWHVCEEKVCMRRGYHRSRL